MSVSERVVRVAAVVESLEREMELLCVTGVEDRLQEGVRPTLELLRNAGIKVEGKWKQVKRNVKYFVFLDLDVDGRQIRNCNLYC
jgi:hypothetical protein